MDPKSGKLIISKQKIKEASLQYCIDTLSKYEPDLEYQEVIRRKKETLNTKLQEGKGNFILQRETFDFVVLKFQRSKKKNYDFLVKSGKSFKTAVFHFTKIMCQKERFPETLKKNYVTYDL